MYPIEKYQFKTYETINANGTKSTVVIALSTYGGKVVRGVAKCMENDAFSLEHGKKLAAARCDLKVCTKRQKRALKKFNESSIALDEAQVHFNEMLRYYSESVKECLDAASRLADIEKNLM